jgi:hypothetical protein
VAPQRIGDYRILRELARGGMGVVYVALQEGLDRRVALKLLLASRESPKARARFEQEAHAVARLHHPNIVAIHHVGLHQGSPFLVMDLIEGESLEMRIERGPVDPREAARAVEHVARAVHHAHSQGILHRDIKPGNVLVTTDRALLTDFGLAKDLSAERERLTISGQLLGTPVFMPPEQAAGEHDRIDERSDVYSLGMTLYQALTCEVPFVGESLLAVLTQIVEALPAAPSSHVAGIPSELDAVVLKCLSKDKNDRYATAAELADDLERWRRDEPVTASRSGMATRARHWLRRGRRSPAAWLTGLVLGVAAVVVVVQQAVLAPREHARAALHAELSWQSEHLAPALFGLAPGTSLDLDAGELRRREAILEGIERSLGATLEVRAALANLEAHQRLLELRREHGRAPAPPVAMGRALPHLLVDALVCEAQRDLPATWSRLEEAAKAYPQAPAVERVRLALRARYDVAAFLAQAQSGKHADLALSLAPRALERGYTYLLGPTFGGTADTLQASLVSLRRAVTEWAALSSDALVRAKVTALEASASGWRTSPPTGRLLLARLAQLEAVLRHEPRAAGLGGPVEAPALVEALALQLTRALTSCKPLSLSREQSPGNVERIEAACEIERVTSLFDNTRRREADISSLILRLPYPIAGRMSRSSLALLHATLRHGNRERGLPLLCRLSPEIVSDFAQRYPECPGPPTLLTYVKGKPDVKRIGALLASPRFSELHADYRAALRVDLVSHLRHLRPISPQDVERMRVHVRDLVLEPVTLNRQWLIHLGRLWLKEVEGSPFREDAASRRYVERLRRASAKDEVARESLVLWLERLGRFHSDPELKRVYFEEALGHAVKEVVKARIRARLTKLNE